MEDSWTKVEVKRSKNVFQILIMDLQAEKDLTKLKPNPIIISHLQFEDCFNKLEEKLSPTLKTKVTSMGWSLFGGFLSFWAKNLTNPIVLIFRVIFIFMLGGNKFKCL